MRPIELNNLPKERRNLEQWIINKNQSKSSIKIKTWNQSQSIKISQICNIITQLTEYQNLESWIINKDLSKSSIKIKTQNRSQSINQEFSNL